jgi:SAM-dependent methyltransferase
MIAVHLIYHEIRGEKKYKIDTTGADELQEMEEKGIDISHATMYMPAGYKMLEDFFSRISAKHLVDFGCGKGRVLCVAPHFGIKKVTGIDFSKEFCTDAKINLENIKIAMPDLEYKVCNNDAFYFDIPEDADCLFFFNPFDEMIMSGVIENIQISLEEFPRPITVIYFNPLHKKLFEQIGFKEVYYSRKLKYLEGSIMKNPA